MLKLINVKEVGIQVIYLVKSDILEPYAILVISTIQEGMAIFYLNRMNVNYAENLSISIYYLN